MNRAEIAATGLDLPEGPVMLADGHVAFVQQLRSTASRLVDGMVETIGCAPGAWNSLTVGADGNLYAPQNRGVRTPYLATQSAAPGIQRIAPDGTVTTVVTAVGGTDVLMPNDLAFGPDGRLWFTDPAHVFNPETRGTDGRVFAVGQDGGEVIAEVGAAYCNGITFDGDGRLLWVESYDRYLCTVDETGHRVVIAQLPEKHVPDGLAAATDGRLFIATVYSHGVTVTDRQGRVLDHIALGDDSFPTNVCFDGSALWVTDFSTEFASAPGRGRLWRIETDAIGVPLHTGAL